MHIRLCLLGNRVSLSFSDFDLADSDFCNDDYLEIREGASNGKLLATLCGETSTTITNAKGLWIFFRSNTREKDDTTERGFMAHFQYGNN